MSATIEVARIGPNTKLVTVESDGLLRDAWFIGDDDSDSSESLENVAENAKLL